MKLEMFLDVFNFQLDGAKLADSTMNQIYLSQQSYHGKSQKGFHDSPVMGFKPIVHGKDKVRML